MKWGFSLQESWWCRQRGDSIRNASSFAILSIVDSLFVVADSGNGLTSVDIFQWAFWQKENQKIRPICVMFVNFCNRNVIPIWPSPPRSSSSQSMFAFHFSITPFLSLLNSFQNVFLASLFFLTASYTSGGVAHRAHYLCLPMVWCSYISMPFVLF